MKKQLMLWLSEGWHTTKQHPWLITMLLLYQLFWGFILYRFIQSIVLPLLYRYPSALSAEAVNLFLAESQFRLLKTDISSLALWILAVIIVIRMGLTPLINAGIYYSVHRNEPKQIEPFIHGIRTLGFSFIIIYGCQLALTALPLYWLVPYFIHLFVDRSGYEDLLLAALPWLLGYGAYLILLRLCFMHIQFAKACGASLLRSQQLFWRHFVALLSLYGIMLFLSFLLAFVSFSVSILWAGLFIMILHQLMYFFKTWMKLWEISSQYQIWRTHL